MCDDITHVLVLLTMLGAADLPFTSPPRGQEPSLKRQVEENAKVRVFSYSQPDRLLLFRFLEVNRIKSGTKIIRKYFLLVQEVFSLDRLVG